MVVVKEQRHKKGCPQLYFHGSDKRLEGAAGGKIVSFHSFYAEGACNRHQRVHLSEVVGFVSGCGVFLDVAGFVVEDR